MASIFTRIIGGEVSARLVRVEWRKAYTDGMKELGGLLSAIGSLLWPLLAFAVFLAYRKEIRSLLRRVRRGKLLGQEIELEESLDKLEASAKQAIVEVAAAPTPAPQIPGKGQTNQDDTSVERIIEQAAQSPKAALLLLASEIERELRLLLASTGWHGGRRAIGLKQGFELLGQTESLPRHVANSLRLFSDMRNRLVHGGAASDDEVLRALDSGLTILKALREIPHEVHNVYRAGVELFTDPELTQSLTDVRGIILESTSSGGAKQLRIFPTTKRHFQKGNRVAWEWNDGKVWGPAWYRDPDTGQPKQAWQGSMEFTGRQLDEV